MQLHTSLNLNDVVLIKIDDVGVPIDQRNAIGIIRYIGTICGHELTEFVGIELLDAIKGAHDGTINGFQYFQTKPNHGWHVRMTNIVKKLNAADVVKKMRQVIDMFTKKLEEFMSALHCRNLNIVKLKKQICQLQQRIKNLKKTSRTYLNETQKRFSNSLTISKKYENEYRVILTPTPSLNSHPITPLSQSSLMEYKVVPTVIKAVYNPSQVLPENEVIGKKQRDKGNETNIKNKNLPIIRLASGNSNINNSQLIIYESRKCSKSEKGLKEKTNEKGTKLEIPVPSDTAHITSPSISRSDIADLTLTSDFEATVSWTAESPTQTDLSEYTDDEFNNGTIEQTMSSTGERSFKYKRQRKAYHHSLSEEIYTSDMYSDSDMGSDSDIGLIVFKTEKRTTKVSKVMHARGRCFVHQMKKRNDKIQKIKITKTKNDADTSKGEYSENDVNQINNKKAIQYISESDMERSIADNLSITDCTPSFSESEPQVANLPRRIIVKHLHKNKALLVNIAGNAIYHGRRMHKTQFVSQHRCRAPHSCGSKSEFFDHSKIVYYNDTLTPAQQLCIDHNSPYALIAKSVRNGIPMMNGYPRPVVKSVRSDHGKKYAQLSQPVYAHQASPGLSPATLYQQIPLTKNKSFGIHQRYQQCQVERTLGRNAFINRQQIQIPQMVHCSSLSDIHISQIKNTRIRNNTYTHDNRNVQLKYLSLHQMQLHSQSYRNNIQGSPVHSPTYTQSPHVQMFPQNVSMNVSANVL